MSILIRSDERIGKVHVGEFSGYQVISIYRRASYREFSITRYSLHILRR